MFSFPAAIRYACRHSLLHGLGSCRSVYTNRVWATCTWVFTSHTMYLKTYLLTTNSDTDPSKTARCTTPAIPGHPLSIHSHDWCRFNQVTYEWQCTGNGNVNGNGKGCKSVLSISYVMCITNVSSSNKDMKGLSICTTMESLAICRRLASLRSLFPHGDRFDKVYTDVLELSR